MIKLNLGTRRKIAFDLIVMVFVIAYLSLASASAREFYVSPDGSSNGKGKSKKPWDLQTALNHPGKVKPGDTIYLLGGTYQGKFVGKLVGTPDQPITVRSYPGEWARIDISLQGRLAASIDATDSKIHVTDVRGFRPDTFVLIEDEPVFVESVSFADNTITVWRNYPRNVGNGVPHLSGARIRFVKTQQSTAGLCIVGQYTIYRDFEVFSSQMTRVTNDFNTQDDPDSTGGATALEAGSVGNKLVNIIMHDAAGGSGGVGSPDSEVYGSIIYNNGWVSPNRGNGHGFYIHNPTPSLFKVVDNLIFNNFGYGLHGFAQNANGFVNNIWMEGNISFNNGSPGTYPGNVANQRPNFRFTNLWVGAEPNGPKNITYKNNYVYSPPGTSVGGGVLSYGYGNAIGENVRVEGNYISGGIGTIGIGNTLSAMVTGNTVVSFYPSAGEMVSAKAPSSYSYVWDNNRYFAVTPVISGCSSGDDRAVPFIFVGNEEGSCGGFSDFNDWKRLTGFDTNGQFSFGVPPTNEIFIRPNKYETGRAYIAVYNWQNNPTETISAARVASEIGLVAGQQFEIRNAQNFLGAPVASGVYGGGSLTLPLTGPEALGVAAPINNPGGFAPASTCPQFCVFVLLPITANSSIPSSVVGASASGPGANFKNAPANVSSTLGSLRH